MAVALAAALAACAGGDSDVPQSEFLGDLGRLERVADTDGFAAWKNAGADLKRYRRVLLDPVEVHAAAADPAMHERIRTYFRQSAMLAINDAYPVADAPDRDVVRVRAAIVGLGTARATVETELRDSITGERVAAIVERPAPGATLDAWPEVEKTLDGWAKLLRARLDALRS